MRGKDAKNRLESAGAKFRAEETLVSFPLLGFFSYWLIFSPILLLPRGCHNTQRITFSNGHILISSLKPSQLITGHLLSFPSSVWIVASQSWLSASTLPFWRQVSIGGDKDGGKCGVQQITENTTLIKGCGASWRAGAASQFTFLWCSDNMIYRRACCMKQSKFHYLNCLASLHMKTCLIGFFFFPLLWIVQWYLVCLR